MANTIKSTPTILDSLGIVLDLAAENALGNSQVAEDPVVLAPMKARQDLAIAEVRQHIKTLSATVSSPYLDYVNDLYKRLRHWDGHEIGDWKLDICRMSGSIGWNHKDGELTVYAGPHWTAYACGEDAAKDHDIKFVLYDGHNDHSILEQPFPLIMNVDQDTALYFAKMDRFFKEDLPPLLDKLRKRLNRTTYAKIEDDAKYTLSFVVRNGLNEEVYAARFLTNHTLVKTNGDPSILKETGYLFGPVQQFQDCVNMMVDHVTGNSNIETMHAVYGVATHFMDLN